MKMKMNGNKLILILILICALAGAVSASSPPYVTLTPTPVITPIVPIMTYSAGFNNITNSSFNIGYIGVDALMPYSWTFMGSFVIVTFLIIMFPFLAMWWGGGNLRYPAIIGILFGFALLFGSASGGLGITLPPEVGQIAFGVIIASIAALLLSFWKKI